MAGEKPKYDPGVWPGARLQPFLDYLLVECGLSANTLLAYRRDLVRFAGYCLGVSLNSARKLRPLDIQNYARDLSQARLCSSSVARHLAAVRMFLRFELLSGEMTKDICRSLESPKLWKRLPHVLSPQKTNELLAGAGVEGAQALRDGALLELLYATGLRASEAAGLKLSDINRQVGFIRIIGKGNKERVVPVHARALERLWEYLPARAGLVKGPDHGFVFVSRTGRALSRIEIWRVVRRAATAAGLVGKISPHTLRHCFGSHLLQGGADLRSVQEMLGHADVTTTQIYTQVDQNHIRNIHKKYHPRA